MRWYYGWNVMAVTVLFQGLTYGLGLYSFTFWVEPWMAEFGASRADLMWATALSIAAMGLMAPFAGRAMAAVSKRVLVCAGALLFSLGFVLIALAGAAWQIVAVYATLIAAGLLLTGPLVAQSLGAAWFRRHRGLAIGIGISGLAFGGFVVPPLATWLLGLYGWRAAHLILAGLVAGAILPVTWLVVRDTPEQAGVAPEAGGERSAAMDAALDDRSWSLGEILRSRAFWIIVIAFFTPNFAFRGIQQNLGPYAADIGIDAQTASFIMAGSAGLQALSKLVFGALGDRWDARILYWIAMTCLGLSAVLLIGRPAAWEIVGFAVLMGIAAGEFTMLGVFVSTQFGARDFGKVMGLALLFITLGSFGAVFAGWVRDTFGSYDIAYLVLLGLLVPSMLSMLFLSRGGRRREAPMRARPAPGE
ncbi:MAG: MFS transporter [Alphaproteobacteria bacterium]|nr:MFS transporter [Alphaproteobacteria bacterium]